MQGILYLIATPIGNLEDITLRAIRILSEVDLIAAEDTRYTLQLLNHLHISKPLISYHRHNEEIKTEIIIEKLKQGQNIAIVSDAGTPAISDPGEEIVKKAIDENIKVISIPGACALISGLICSGISTKEFVFLGFLSINKKLRKEKLMYLKRESKTIILYEAPHKIKRTLIELKEVLENRKIVLARELTKKFEEIIRGTVEEVIEKLENPLGEFVIIIEGTEREENKTDANWLNNLEIEEHFNYYINNGLDKKEAIKKVAKDKNITKNEIYKKFI